jgi:outer membrane protein OmpA-like peptidoglycan-associated protein
VPRTTDKILASPRTQPGTLPCRLPASSRSYRHCGFYAAGHETHADRYGWTAVAGGGGLTLRIPCDLSGAHEPEDGTRLVKDSLYRLPAADADLTGISGELVTARDTAGVKVLILVFNSDELFATGSDVINSTDTLDATIRLINAHYPKGAIQVRGHTDATGTPANNQGLSQHRAEHVRAYLSGHGTSAASITATGLGSSQPLTEEKNPDGSISAAGRAFNRRVEIVIRLPS